MDTLIKAFLRDLRACALPDDLANEGELRHRVADQLERTLATEGETGRFQILCEGRDLCEGRRQIVPMHVLRGSFWPDITVVRGDATDPVAAVEVKLLRGTSPGPIATALGQAFCYRYGKATLREDGKRLAGVSPYPWAIVVVIDERRESKRNTMECTPREDDCLGQVLEGQQIALVVRRSKPIAAQHAAAPDGRM